MSDAALLRAIYTRRIERGDPMAPPLAIGVTLSGRIWLSTSRGGEGRYAGNTLAEAAEAWLAAHPGPAPCPVCGQVSMPLLGQFFCGAHGDFSETESKAASAARKGAS